MIWGQQSSQKDQRPLPIHCVQLPYDPPHPQSRPR